MVSMVLLIPSCQKNSGVSEEEKALSLEAPSGQQIAVTIQELKSEASDMLRNKFGTGTDFQLTLIEYLPAAKGYAAIIHYRLEDGTTGNYGIFSEVSFAVAPGSVSDLAVRKTVDPIEAGRVTITCVKKGSCECRLSATINTDTGVITVSCGCSTCNVTVVEIPEE